MPGKPSIPFQKVLEIKYCIDKKISDWNHNRQKLLDDHFLSLMLERVNMLLKH